MSSSPALTPSRPAPNSEVGDASVSAGARAWHANPVWRREMIQSSRLARTPMILMSTCIVLTVITCSVGGLASSSVDPAVLGSVLYHVFFSLCFAMVAWVGPGVGTLLVTSEHSSKTWDSLVLTGLAPRSIATGKFLAAFSYVGQYLVTVAPIGAVAFIAGGVTAPDVLLGYLLLLIFTAIAVGFGISVGAAVRSAAPAMLISVTTATVVSFACFVGLGVGAATLAHDAWPAVTPAAPVWLPTAYTRAALGLDYLATLVYLPLSISGCLLWFFYEATVASMSPGTRERFFGLKRWALFAFPLLVLASLVPRLWLDSRDHYWASPAISMVFSVALGGALVLVLCAEGPGDATRSGAPPQGLRRFLSSAFGRGHALILVLSFVTLSGLLCLGTWQELETATVLGSSRLPYIVLLGALALSGFGFLTFCTGLNLFVRARSSGALAARGSTIAAAVIVLIGPWIVLAIAGLLAGSVDSALWLACPSPLFWLVLVDQVVTRGQPQALELWVHAGVSTAWFVAGAVFWLVARRTLVRRSEAQS